MVVKPNTILAKKSMGQKQTSCCQIEMQNPSIKCLSNVEDDEEAKGSLAYSLLIFQ